MTRSANPASRTLQRSLWRTRRTAGLISLAGFFATALAAQMHKVAPPERVTRAIAVYEWTGDLAKPTAARIVPVSLFINGHFEDAGLYLARPMPFALQTGVIYSVEQAGLPKGTIDLEYARDVVTRHSATDDSPSSAWYGYGPFQLPPPAPREHILHASSRPAAIVGSSDPDRPHLTNRSPADTSAKPAASTDTKPAASTSRPAADNPPADPDRPVLNRRADSTPDTTAPAATPDPKPAAPDSKTGDTAPADPDRPTLSRRADSASNAPTKGDVPDDDPDRPTLRKRDPKEDAKRKKAASGSGVTGMDTSLNDDPSRPTMHRGKPAGEVTIPELKSLPPNLHQVAAISDPVNRPAHLFARDWATPTERTEILSGLESLARPRLAKYLTTNQLTASPAATAPVSVEPATRTTSTTAHRRNPAKTPPPPIALENEDLAAYTLSYGGLPTFVYTAESPLAANGPIYLTLVAQQMPSGDLQVALSSVTDANHLDRTPWFRLVDAVDPDAGHRASLLFELRAQHSRQFALYSLTTAHAEQLFVSRIME